VKFTCCSRIQAQHQGRPELQHDTFGILSGFEESGDTTDWDWRLALLLRERDHFAAMEPMVFPLPIICYF